MNNDAANQPDAPDQPPASAEEAARRIREAVKTADAGMDLICLQLMEFFWELRGVFPEREDFERFMKTAILPAAGFPKEAAEEVELSPAQWELIRICQPVKAGGSADAWGASLERPAIRAMIGAAPRFAALHPSFVLDVARRIDRGQLSGDDIEGRFLALPAGPNRDNHADRLLGELTAEMLHGAIRGPAADLRTVDEIPGRGERFQYLDTMRRAIWSLELQLKRRRRAAEEPSNE